MERFQLALNNSPEVKRPLFTTTRHACVYDRPDQADVALHAAISQLGRFENLFKNLVGVDNGFPEEIDLTSISSRTEFDRQTLRQSLIRYPQQGDRQAQSVRRARRRPIHP